MKKLITTTLTALLYTSPLLAQTPEYVVIDGEKILPGVTLENFNRLKPAMAYDQVKLILGSGGTLISETTIGETTTRMYQWEADGFGEVSLMSGLEMGNMNAMFQNGKLQTKSQFGLK